MKKTLNVFSLVFNLFFMLGAVYVVIIFNNLPSQLIITLSKTNALSSLYFLLAIGLISIIIASLRFNQSFSREIIYVDKIVKESEINTVTNDNDRYGKSFIDKIRKEFSVILASNNSSNGKLDKVTSLVCNRINACQGILFRSFIHESKEYLQHASSYAFLKGPEPLEFSVGDGMPGLAAKENRIILMNNIPDGYINIVSGLGKSSQVYVALIPIRYENSVIGVLELALLENPGKESLVMMGELSIELGTMMNSIRD